MATDPICGMDLEPKFVTAEDEDDTELRSIMLRFWLAVALSTPVFLLAMLPTDRWLSSVASRWIQFA